MGGVILLIVLMVLLFCLCVGTPAVCAACCRCFGKKNDKVVHGGHNGSVIGYSDGGVGEKLLTSDQVK